VPLRLGALPADRVRLPAYTEPSRHVFIDGMVDDRQASADFATSPYRELSLKQLREKGLESEIESRFDGIARLIVDFLRKRYPLAEREGSCEPIAVAVERPRTPQVRALQPRWCKKAGVLIPRHPCDRHRRFGSGGRMVCCQNRTI